MISLWVILAAMLATVPEAFAQEAVEPPEQAEQPAAAAEMPVRRAIPRSAAPRRTDAPRRTPAPVPAAARTASLPEAPQPAEAAAGDDQRRAVPRGSRPQGDNPRTGTAVPRAARPGPAGAYGGRAADGRRTVIVGPPAAYNNYYNYPRYYYPRRSYPYGYGAFGLGFFYYNPYRWYPGPYSTYAGPGYYYPGSYGYGFDIGELRLQVSPRQAQVFVDGYYAGIVDDYDGTFQSLKLASGAYAIQIVAPGYGTLDFDVQITPGQKITYRGALPQVP